MSLEAFNHDRLLETIERVYRRFRSTGAGIHLDMKRINGKLTFQGYPIFKWQGAAHLAEMSLHSSRKASAPPAPIPCMSQTDRIVIRDGHAIDSRLPDYRELDGLF